MGLMVRSSLLNDREDPETANDFQKPWQLPMPVRGLLADPRARVSPVALRSSVLLWGTCWPFGAGCGH